MIIILIQFVFLYLLILYKGSNITIFKIPKSSLGVSAIFCDFFLFIIILYVKTIILQKRLTKFLFYTHCIVWSTCSLVYIQIVCLRRKFFRIFWSMIVFIYSIYKEVICFWSLIVNQTNILMCIKKQAALIIFLRTLSTTFNTISVLLI